MPTKIEIVWKYFPAKIGHWNALSATVEKIVDHKKFREKYIHTDIEKLVFMQSNEL